jgi:DNA mismatch repair ATPase MutS
MDIWFNNDFKLNYKKSDDILNKIKKQFNYYPIEHLLQNNTFYNYKIIKKPFFQYYFQNEELQEQELVSDFLKNFDKIQEIKQDIHQNFDKIQDIHQNFDKIQDIPKNFDKIQDIPQNFDKIQDIPKNFDKIQDIPQNFDKIQDIPKNFDKIEDIPQNFDKIQDIPKNFDKIEDIPQNFDKIQDIPKNFDKIHEKIDKNNKKKKRKKRCPYGPRLKRETVLKIYKLYNTEFSANDVAIMYNINVDVIRNIWNKKTYKKYIL